MLDEPHGAPDHRRRATVVGLQVHPPQAGQAARQAQDAAHVREAPGVDRLVVVADQEDVPRRLTEEQRQVELRAVDVLDLVDEQRRAPCPPPVEERGVAPQELERAGDQVVEVQGDALGERRAVTAIGLDQGRFGLACCVGIQPEPREAVIQAPELGTEDRPPGDPGEDGRAVHQPRDVDSGIGQDLAAERMERSDANRTGGHLERREGLDESLIQLDRGPLVEGDRGDGRGIGSGIDQPGDPCHERGRLSRSGGRDAEHRTSRRGRSGTLVGRQPSETLLDGRVGHGLILAVATSPRLTSRLGSTTWLGSIGRASTRLS
jgi:hypothetical protein